MVGQPAEETVDGARGMIADGLFTRFPKPDTALAVHGRADLAAGRVSWVAGYAMANVDAADITLYGKGSHGARPELSVDPVVLAARTVLALQTLISREKDPLEPAVLTVGSIHGGTKHNIIPDEVKLQLTLRSYNPAVRAQMRAGIVRIAKAESLAAGSPREPMVAFSEGQEATWNDPALTRRVAAALARSLGAENVEEGRPDMVAEDFGEFGKAAKVPSLLLRTGVADPAKLKSGAALPSLHSSVFAPDRERAIRTGATVLFLSALEVLGKP
jgi:hippurate hydrolase